MTRRIIEAADVDDALIEEALDAVEGWTPEGERIGRRAPALVDNGTRRT
jgi:hypothetical protein